MSGPTAPAGLLLAAGQGRRMGRPKALVELDGVPLVNRALDVLRGGGLHPLLVVVGAAADEVTELLPADAHVVRAADWSEGMGASLRAGLAALAELRPTPVAVVVHLVDLPGVSAHVVRRLAALSAPDALARACYAGAPGHPVLFGRAHWDGLRAGARGDAAGRSYLAARTVEAVECGDIGESADMDTPDELRRYLAGHPGAAVLGPGREEPRAGPA